MKKKAHQHPDPSQPEVAAVEPAQGPTDAARDPDAPAGKHVSSAQRLGLVSVVQREGGQTELCRDKHCVLNCMLNIRGKKGNICMIFKN